MEVIYFFFSITFSQISQQVGLYVLKTLFQCCFVYINLQAQSVELREGALANVKMISASFFFVGLDP